MKAGPDLVNTFEQRPARYLKSRVEWIGKTCIDFTGWLSYYQINFVSANLWLCFTLTGRIENKDTKKTTPHIHVGRGVGLARTIYIRFTYGIFGLEITKYTVYLYVYIRFWPTLKKRRVVMAVEQIHIVGQNRIYAPYMTVYLIESLPKTPYIHRIHMVLSNPTIRTCQVLRLFRKHAPYEMCHSFKYRDISFFLFPLRLR
jgi:hypothetical protein